MKLDPAEFRTENERVEAIADCFRFYKQFKVLSFWESDQQVNPRGLSFTTQGPTAHIQNQAA